MNARTALPLAILLVLASHPVGVSVAADATGAPAPAGAALPDNEAQAKARAALYAEEAPVAVQAQPTLRPAPVESRAVVAQPGVEPPLVVSTAAGPQPDNEAQAKARAALYAEEPAPVAVVTAAPAQPAGMASSEQRVAVETTPPPAAKPAKPATVGMTQATGMEAPVLPTNPSQKEQLDALLARYRADQISPSEYHARRAEILAGN